ncbi:MAG: hypothetical protein VYC39_16465 [Myxococcota bacterium]|nr:hypothetical protein [Myxococcota bacterium]
MDRSLKILVLVINLVAGLATAALPASANSVWVWGNNENAAKYIPDTKYTQAVGSGEAQIERLSPGKYQLTLSGWEKQPPTKSNVQVTSYGVGSAYCKVASWSPSGKTLMVNILCFATGGTPKDSKFSVLISFENTARTAFAWSSNTVKDHVAKEKFAKNDKQPVFIKRNERGIYSVTFTRFLSNGRKFGNAQATAQGRSQAYCKIRDWKRVRADLTVQVSCFSPNGEASDSLFSILVSSP